MPDYPFEEIRAFNSPGEFKRFLRWIEEQVVAGRCEELTGHDHSIFLNQSRRFRCISTGRIWKLSCPDPGYFPGSWLPESKFIDII